MSDAESHRVLVVDDDPLIAKSLVRLLRGGSRLFQAASPAADSTPFTPPRLEVDQASQGQDALELVKRAVAAEQPYAVAFVDIRMPPGWDGIETIEHLWAVDPKLQVIICTAHSDYAWSDIVERLGARDALLVLKKPFDAVEALQMVHALTGKWTLTERAALKLHQLEQMTAERTHELADAYARLKAESSERERIAGELLRSQKLDAMGQLAAGIAHEVNTPAQFVGDNVDFLEQSFHALVRLVESCRASTTSDANCPCCQERLQAFRRLEEQTDLAFLQEQIPRAIEAALDGVTRISRIVRAMRRLVHPSPEGKIPTDLNPVVIDALEVARSRYRRIARVEIDLGELPQVPCRPGDIGSAVLNLVVNAAQAIEDRASEAPGCIRITTRAENEHAVISVQDDGCGIPVIHYSRVLEPFFTTKSVDRGTGQGLALAHAVVEKQHGGELTFESEEGVGTTFTMRLPLREPVETLAANSDLEDPP